MPLYIHVYRKHQEKRPYSSPGYSAYANLVVCWSQKVANLVRNVIFEGEKGADRLTEQFMIQLHKTTN